MSGVQQPLDDFNVQHEYNEYIGVNVTPVPSNQNDKYKLYLSEVEHEICVESNNFYIKQDIIQESKFKPEATKEKRRSMMISRRSIMRNTENSTKSMLLN